MINNVQFYGLWALRILAGLAFLAAGFAKLTSAAMMVEVFNQIGFGQWFRYVTGAIEIAGAVILFVPNKTFYGAALLAATMIGAVLTHLVLIGGSAVPALILLLIVSVIAFATRTQFKALT